MTTLNHVQNRITMSEHVKKVNIRQKEALVGLIEENQVFLFGKFNNSAGKGSKDAKWIEIVAELNKLGPPTKDVASWKKVSISN